MKTSPKQYIETPRLILRDWKEEDIPVFARLNSDDRVMEFFLNKLSYQETLDFYNRIQKEFASRGYGLYAVEKKEDQAFLFLHLTPQQAFGACDAEDRYGKK